jgi:hypothetical protein
VTPCFMSDVIETRRRRILNGAQHEQYSGAHAILVALSPAEDALTVVPQDLETINHLRGGPYKSIHPLPAICVGAPIKPFGGPHYRVQQHLK